LERPSTRSALAIQELTNKVIKRKIEP